MFSGQLVQNNRWLLPFATWKTLQLELQNYFNRQRCTCEGSRSELFITECLFYPPPHSLIYCSSHSLVWDARE